MAIATTPHDELVATMTGGMAPTQSRTEIARASRLRPDFRPNPDFRAELRTIANFRNALTVFTILVAPVVVTVAVIAIGSWWAIIPAAMVMGNIQTRMYILHHEAAHRLLFSDHRINDLIGVNLLGWLPFGTGTHHYRRGHSNHHRDEFGPNEPDFLLYSFYPITKPSMHRKLRRDATGVSAYRLLKPLLSGFVTRERLPLSLRFLAGQILVFTAFLAAGAPWLYLWLWALPFFTWYQVQNRLRSIGEHGGMTRSSDRRDTTHHVEQHWIARLLITPYDVGYHLAHHVDSGVPFRNLHRLHDELVSAGYLEGASVWPNYRSLWNTLVQGHS